MPPHRPNTLDRGIRLFEHPLLDWGSRVHPALPGLFWGPVAVAALAASVRYGLGPLAIGAWFVAGYAAWMFAEYALHRWFFHFRPRSARLQRVFYVVHEHHHRYQERDRLLAPPLMSLSIGAIFVGAFFLAVAPGVGFGPMWAFAAGFCVSYLVYDYTHYFIHFAKPRTRWGRFVRRCHLEHHFSTPDRWFCISFPPLDYLSARSVGAGRGPTSPGRTMTIRTAMLRTAMTATAMTATATTGVGMGCPRSCDGSKRPNASRSTNASREPRRCPSMKGLHGAAHGRETRNHES